MLLWSANICRKKEHINLKNPNKRGFTSKKIIIFFLIYSKEQQIFKLRLRLNFIEKFTFFNHKQHHT